MAHDNGHDVNGAGYEVADASIREIIFTGIGLVVGTVIVCIAVAGLFKVLTATDGNSRQSLTQVPAAQSFPPTPRLEQRPWLELQGLRKHEDQVLSTYGWADKNAGKVRIPIDKAMDLVIQHGLPVRAEGAPGGAGSARTVRNPGTVPSEGASPQMNRGGAKANAQK